ncbi:hypothetical protein [Candidatus Vallotia cooleyia]|uniref:hypothetical protein n=1 Tax=Candidatus Vallotiella adelgis TaxID=1177211 RepID=UPI001D015402|nr:hypothetical protein [Candidatus Vallotia cooleyia]
MSSIVIIIINPHYEYDAASFSITMHGPEARFVCTVDSLNPPYQQINQLMSVAWKLGKVILN